MNRPAKPKREPYLPRCPICGEGTSGAFITGEFVDVGVGSVQCTPDLCYRCGYEQPGNYSDDGIHRARCEAVEECRFVWNMTRGAPAGAD